MATRKQVREAFYSKLETAADGLVSPKNIGQEYPEATEDLPTIVHNDAYRRVPMNNKTGPTDVTRSGGTIQTLHYAVPMQAQFTVLVMSADEMEKENIYEAVRTYFEEFTLPVADESDIHPDVHRVEVTDVNSQDDENREPIARGDSLTINLGFERVYDRDVDGIESIDQAVDVGTITTGDGEDEFTYTIS